MENQFIGQSKNAIKRYLSQKSQAFSEFGVWLYIASDNLLLSFDKQYCHKVAYIGLQNDRCA